MRNEKQSVCRNGKHSVWEQPIDFRYRWRRSRKCSGDWIYRDCRALLPLHPQIVATRPGTFTSSHCWSCGILRTVQETWVVGSSIPVGLPPSPTAVMAQLGFEDAAVLGFSIYKYLMHLLQNTHISLTFFIFLNPPPPCTFPLHSPFHLLFFLSWFILLLYNYFFGFIEFLLF